MDKSISARIAALTDTLQQWKMEQALPIDPLSQAIYELETESVSLAALGAVLESDDH